MVAGNEYKHQVLNALENITVILSLQDKSSTEMEYYLPIKEWNIAICSNMGEPRDYYTKWSKSDRKRQILYDITYM